MRRLLRLATILLILPAVLVSPAMAVQQCRSEADQSVFDVLALRELMTVLVIKCNRAENDYNVNFVKRFQRVLQQNDRAALAYFRRVYGASGQGRMDSFTTELVNDISQVANTQGSEFCARTGWVVNEMSALPSMEDLPAYAAVKDIAPPGVNMCPATNARR